MVNSAEVQGRSPGGARATGSAGSDLSVVVEALGRLNDTLKAVEERLAATGGTGGVGGPGGPPAPPTPSRAVASAENALGLIDAALALDPTPITIADLIPAEGAQAGGDRVTITGQHFAPGATVFFGNNAAPNVEFVDGTRLTVTTPPGFGRVSVAVSYGDIAVKPDAFTYRAT
jgi:hypothetical protein